MVGVVVVTVEVDRSLAQQGADDGEGLREPADAMVVGEAEGVVLPPIPSGAETEDQTSAGDGIDGGRHLGQHGRRVEARRRDQRAEPDGRGGGGDRGERCPHLPRSSVTDVESVEQVVAEPERIEPDRLGGPGHLDELGEGDLPLDLGELDTDLHARYRASVKAR